MLKKVFLGVALLIALFVGGSAALSHFTNKTPAVAANTQTPTTTVVSLPDQIAALKIELETSQSVNQARFDEIMAKLAQIENEIAQGRK